MGEEDQIVGRVKRVERPRNFEAEVGIRDLIARSRHRRVDAVEILVLVIRPFEVFEPSTSSSLFPTPSLTSDFPYLGNVRSFPPIPLTTHVGSAAITPEKAHSKATKTVDSWPNIANEM